MELKKMNVQKVKGSYFIYIPKVWARRQALKKGDKVVCSIEEGDHETLHLKKEINGVTDEQRTK